MARSTGLVDVDDEDRATLLNWSRSSSVRAGLAMRAKIVLAAANGEGTTAISRRLGVSRPTVIQWRDRYVASGLAGLDDAERSGRPKTVNDAAIIAATLEPPPARLGVTHWSTRLLAGELGSEMPRRAGVAPLRGAALAAGDVQVLHRPAAGGQGPRRGGPVPQPAAEGGRAVRGREVPDPGAGPDRTDPAAAARPAGEGHP